jgi:hypothetical protein
MGGPMSFLQVEGGASFAFKFPSNGFKPQGNVLKISTNTITPLINPTPYIKY